MPGAAQQPRVPLPLDLVAVGTTFLDLVFAGVVEPPAPGAEVFAGALGFSLGGAVTVAAQAAALGAESALVTEIGGDSTAELVRRMLGDLGLRLDWIADVDSWRQPVTVSMATAADRAMVSYYEPLPSTVTRPLVLPPATISFEYIGHDGPDPITSKDRSSSSMVVYDTGWDPRGAWDQGLLEHLGAADVFTPNAVEAMRFTRTDTALDAAKALAERVPLVIVKDGSGGAIAVDSRIGSLYSSPAPPVVAVDPTGAGDVFAGAFIGALVRGLPPQQCLDLATLAASISVTRLGGAAAVVSWPDLVAAASAYGPEFAHRYAHIAEIAAAQPSPLPPQKESLNAV